MKVIALVSCVSRKQTIASPAKDLYQSDWFKKARAYVEQNHWPWYILSAQHGLLSPDQVITPYERTLKLLPVQDRRKWADGVFHQITDIATLPCCLKIFSGQAYREHLSERLQECGYQIDVPLLGLGIGKQLSWLKSQLN
ncbi:MULTISPECIES: DUF6884 domain-containing protein [Cyanophyceae]|uniref:DUF6884 domain-containing protein n=1 Tax=Cyanophyceae TaxID=3028117 RepID=UPI00325FD8CD